MSGELDDHNNKLRQELQDLGKSRALIESLIRCTKQGWMDRVTYCLAKANNAAKQLGIDLKNLDLWCPDPDAKNNVNELLDALRSEIVKPCAVSMFAQGVFQSRDLMDILLAFGIDVFDVLPKPDSGDGFDTVLKRTIIKGGELGVNDNNEPQIKVDGKPYKLPLATTFLEVATVRCGPVPITSLDSTTMRSGHPDQAQALYFPVSPIDKINELLAGGGPVVVVHRFVDPENLDTCGPEPLVRELDVTKEFEKVNGIPVIVPDTGFYQSADSKGGVVKTVRVYKESTNPRFCEEVNANRAIACVFMSESIARDTGYYGRQPIQIPVHGETPSKAAWAGGLGMDLQAKA